MNTGRGLLTAWLTRSNLQQKDLARRLGVSDGYLSQILSGARRPGMDIARAIESETGIPMGSWVDTRRGKVDEAPEHSAK